jgi:hypothetical protein
VRSNAHSYRQLPITSQALQPPTLMTWNTCPIEVWEHIVHHVSGYSISQTGGSISLSSLVACTATSRALSDLARPLIFAQVTIHSVTRGKTLIALMSNDSKIPRWIKSVHIRSIPYTRFGTGIGITETLQFWLCTPEGLSLLNMLQHGHELKISNFGYWNDNRLLSDAWNALILHSSLRQSVTSLELDSCDIPSSQVAGQILTTAFPRMQRISISDIRILPDKAKVSNFINDVGSASRLRDLTLNNTELGLHVNGLITYLNVANVTRLQISPIDTFEMGLGCYSFTYAQGLLDHARCLERLILTDCDRIWVGANNTISLESNRLIRSLVFKDVKDTSDREWIPNLLKTLSTVANLTHLGFDGWLETVDDETWLNLDSSLADQRFAASPRSRRLIMTTRLRDEVDSAGYIFSEGFLPKTRSLEWFAIECHRSEPVDD